MAVTSTTAEKKSDLKSAAVGFAVGSLLIIAPTTVITLISEFKMKE